jgi:hypothetical protein
MVLLTDESIKGQRSKSPDQETQTTSNFQVRRTAPGRGQQPADLHVGRRALADCDLTSTCSAAGNGPALEPSYEPSCERIDRMVSGSHRSFGRKTDVWGTPLG